MQLWLALLLAIIIFVFIVAIVVLLAWQIMVHLYLPLTNDPGGTSMLTYAVFEFFSHLSSGIYIVPGSLLGAAGQIFNTVRENLPYLLVLGLASTAGFMWLEYHPDIIKAGLIFRQCTVRPILDNLLMPFLNILRIIYNTAIQVWNFGASVMGFLEVGGFVTFLKCANRKLSITQIVTYVGAFFSAVFNDFRVWIRGSPLTNDYNIELSIAAFAKIFQVIIPTFNCFCKALDFIWIYIETLISLPSLSDTLNRAWIAFINLLQIPANALRRRDHQPDFTNVTLNSCGAVIGLGNFFEEAVLLTVETFYGLITNETTTPSIVVDILSVRYTYVLTHPICGVFRVVNMTLIGAINYRRVIATNGTGVAYLQFGEFFDEFKVAAAAIGDIVDVVDNAIPDKEHAQGQAFTTYTLYAIIDIPAFLVEFTIGNVFYLSFGGPLPASYGLYNKPTPTSGPANFFKFYFPDYWFKAMPFGKPIINPVDGSTISFPVKIGNYTYSTALDSFFRNVWRSSQALGDIIGLFNVVLGQVVRHFINILAALLLALANQIAYSYCVLSFSGCDGMPFTERNVNVDLFFNETYFFAGAAGDLFRQFDNVSCTSKVLDANKTILCLSGEIVETTIDVVAITTQQVVHFAQDLLTLPSGQIRPCLFEKTNVGDDKCLRIPDLATAIAKLDDDLCAFSYAVTSLVPTLNALRCPFAPDTGVKTCSTLQTCLGFEFCSILRFIPRILQIINELFIKILSGTSFKDFGAFLTYAVGLLADQLAVVLEQFGSFLDCSLCASLAGIRGETPSNCPATIYNVLHPLADIVRKFARIFTDIFFKLIKVVLEFIVGLFNDPIQAILDFAIGIIRDIGLGGAGAVVNFIANLFDKIHLGFLGSLLRAFFFGLCKILETVINAIIFFLKIFKSYEYVNFFCANSGQSTPSGGKRSLIDMPFVEGNVTYATMHNWLSVMTDKNIWPPEDACNASITEYAAYPFLTLNTYQYGEVSFCIAKLIWQIRNDNQTEILHSNCDRLMIEKKDAAFSSFGITDQSILMECAIIRMVTEGIRRGFNVSWLPQDIGTSRIRQAYFTLGLMHGLLINAQFYNDRIMPPTVVLTRSYQDFWSTFRLDTSRYTNLKTVDDVVNLRQDHHLRSYFESNNATQYDATLYVVSGAWSLVDHLIAGFSSIPDAFSDNITDPSVYLHPDYTQNNSSPAMLSSVYDIIAEFIRAFGQFASFWADTDNYKKRAEAYEAYETVSNATLVLYREAMNQGVLMALEYKNNRTYESTHYYNQTCASEQECRDRGIPQFREAYEASMRGEDELKGATSIVFKLRSFWETTDFTVYPILNPRYKDVRVKEPVPLTYTAEDGSIRIESRWQRLVRHVEIARRGTPAAQRRWVIMNSLYERTRDKVYTQILKHYYRENPTALEEEEQQRSPPPPPVQRPQGHKVCGDDGLCVMRYPFHQDDTAIVAALSLRAESSESSSFLDMPCIRDITFPCYHPLKCDGNTTTSLCVQCYYLQAGVDRVLAATDQTLTYYGPGGRYLKSMDLAIAYFDYSFDANAVAIVGDSPSLNVALFPSQADNVYDFIIRSARYIGDDTANKTRFDRYLQQANLLTASSYEDVETSTLFTRMSQFNDINSQVFSVIKRIFRPLFQILYTALKYFISAGTDKSDLLEFLADDFVFCDWLQGHNLDGTRKHFSIGEMLALYAIVGSAATLLSYTLFGFDFSGFLFSSMFTSMVFFSTFLTLYTDYSLLCAPALPVNLADDIFYFIAYTLLPKCSWVFGATVITPYDNEVCSSCEATQEIEVTHCRYDQGFYDFTYNIAFTLESLFPDFVQDVRSGTGFARVILTIPFLVDRLNYYSTVNLGNTFVWSRFQNCNLVVTIWWNAIIFILYTTAVFIVALPLFGAIYAIFSWLWELASQLLIIILLIANEIIANPYLNAQPYDDGTITGNQNLLDERRERAEAATNDDDDNEDDSVGTKRRYRMEANGFRLSRLFNIFNFLKDNFFGDRKRK